MHKIIHKCWYTKVLLDFNCWLKEQKMERAEIMAGPTLPIGAAALGENVIMKPSRALDTCDNQYTATIFRMHVDLRQSTNTL